MEQCTTDAEFAPRVENPEGSSSVLLVCEHASADMPSEFHSLGLDEDALQSHIAWDPGALRCARSMSQRLDASLVYSTVSRLIYDCNRPPEAASAMPERSEDTQVPGNARLTNAQRQARTAQFYRPFESLLTRTLNARDHRTAIVTIHSFTPVYRGQNRSVEIGILHDDDSRLADAMIDVAAGYDVQRNAPYGPGDGVTHTLRHHALPRGLLNVMIEIRNDLIATPEQCEQMGNVLADWLREAMKICSKSSVEDAIR